VRILYLRQFLSILFIIYQLFTAQFGILPGLNQRIVHLGFALFLCFLLNINTSSKSKLKRKESLSCCINYIDFLFLFFSLIVTIYAFIESPLATGDRAGIVTIWDTVFGVLLIIVLMEATRRVIGLTLPIIAFIFILYALYGNILPYFLGNPGYSISRIIQQIFLSYEGIFGICLAASAKYIVLFVLFGAILNVSGGINFFSDLASGVFGYFRGGPAKVSIVASSLFGMISGSAAANVVATGTLTIPVMKRNGYESEFAAAVEATASTGGQLMPPIMGAAAIIMAEFLGTTYLHVLKAAIFPALLYYIAIFISVDLEAAKTGLKGESKEKLPKIKDTLINGWPQIIPVIFLILCLAIFKWSTLKSILWTVIVSFLICMFKKETRINRKRIVDIIDIAIPNIILIALACAVAGVVIGVFSLTGLGIRISTILITLSGGNLYILLIFTMIASILLGMGLPTVPSYILLAVLVAPALIKMGITPMAAHLYIFYFGVMSNITPPVCIAAYAAAGISGSNPMRTGLKAVKIALAGFIIPYIFVMNPSLILENSNTYETIITLFLCIIAILGLYISVFGYFLGYVSFFKRFFIFVSTFMMVYPSIKVKFMGIIIFGIIIIIEIINNRKKINKEVIINV